MQEQTSSWFSAPSRLLSKAMSAASYGVRCTWNAATAAPVAAVTLATQIPGAVADWACFNVPGNSVPYALGCDGSNTLNTIIKALKTNGTGITPAHAYQCYEATYQGLKYYGINVFGGWVCDLQWSGNLNSLVDNLITQNAPHGVWSNGAVAGVVFMTLVGAGFVGAIVVCTVNQFRKNRGSPLLADEDNRAARTEDQEAAAGNHPGDDTHPAGYQASAAAATSRRAPSPRGSVVDV